MREIKFRGIGREDKRMFDWESFIETMDSGISWKELFESMGVVMQFTGIKDKNGKEIYEGDIVLCSRHDGEDMHEIVIEDIRQLPQFMFGSNLDWREVIGNIYENPELMK